MVQFLKEQTLPAQNPQSFSPHRQFSLLIGQKALPASLSFKQQTLVCLWERLGVPAWETEKLSQAHRGKAKLEESSRA